MPTQTLTDDQLESITINCNRIDGLIDSLNAILLKMDDLVIEEAVECLTDAKLCLQIALSRQPAK